MHHILQAVQQEAAELTAIRRRCHEHPELSRQETQTMAYIQEKLAEYGIASRHIEHGGILGWIDGQNPGKTLLLRADIDALPIEESDCNLSQQRSCRSHTPGVMHACGHDGHAANLLGVAKILNKHRDCLHGTVRLAFQPAEEGNGGAARMIDAGILNNPPVEYALGLHVAGALPKGYVSIRSGEISASCDDFTITLHGKGGHGSQPSECISPIQMGVDVIQMIQSYVYNCRADGDGVVLTFGQFQAGRNPNVIPDTAELKGTLRTYNEAKRRDILDKLRHVLGAVTLTYGGSYDLDVVPFSPVCVNDEAVTARVAAILTEQCADCVDVVPMQRGSGSEDFAYFSAAVPSAFYYVGVCGDEPVVGHSPDFHWDSNALKYMCETLLNVVYYFASYK